MKTLKLILAALAITLTTQSWALVPPAYLGVPHWKDCVSTINKGSASFYCLPSKKPKFCPARSWRQLKSQQLIQACPREQSCPREQPCPNRR